MSGHDPGQWKLFKLESSGPHFVTLLRGMEGNLRPEDRQRKATSLGSGCCEAQAEGEKSGQLFPLECSKRAHDFPELRDALGGESQASLENLGHVGALSGFITTA